MYGDPCPSNPYGYYHAWLTNEERTIATCLCCDVEVRIRRQIDVIFPLERYL